MIRNNQAAGLIVAGTDISSTEIPSEIDILAEGSYKGYVGLDGKEIKQFTVTADHITSCEEHFRERKNLNPDRDLVIDYEHSTLKGGESPAAGWISDLSTIVRDGKKVLRARVRIWTDKAKEYLKNKEYRYISPVFALDAVDKKSGKRVACILFNAALTNEPLFDELQPIVSNVNIQPFFNISGKDSTMIDDLLERLRYFLGLPITATAEAITTELNTLIGQIKTAISSSKESVTASTLMAELTMLKNAVAAKVELFTALGLAQDATVDEAKGMIVAAKNNQTTLQTVSQELATLKQSLLTEKFGVVIAKGLATGRITPAQKDNADWLKTQRGWAESNFASFEDYFTAKAPVIIPLGEIKIDGAAAAPAAGGFTETDLVVAKNLGVTPEQLKKHNS